GIEDVVGFDYKSRYRLDLVVEHENVGIDVRAAVIQFGVRATRNRKVRRESAERRTLPEVGLRGAEPTKVAIQDLGTVLQHDPVKGKSRVGPVEGAEYRVAAEHHILSASFHAQVFYSREVPDQHIAGSDAQDAPIPEPSSGCSAIGPLIVIERGALQPVAAPHG